MRKTKRFLTNKEMSNPDLVHKKQQDWFVLKAAWQRFEWGSAYLPHGIFEAFWIIRTELQRMDEPMKAWKAEKQKFINLKMKKLSPPLKRKHDARSAGARN